ncbi:MAG: hypothetical protein ABIS07_18690 [Dokdonella sp.]
MPIASRVLINRALLIAGINDHYTRTGPDLGETQRDDLAFGNDFD